MKDDFLNYVLSKMTLSEKIGQMIMIDFPNIKEMNKELENILSTYQPGGLIVFTSNVSNYNQFNKLLRNIKDIGNIPAVIAVDQEGGRIQRLGDHVGFQTYPPMAEIGETNSKKIAFKIGAKMGCELKNIGIDMDMAPVLDILSNPHNRVIANRAFGSNSRIVTKMALAYADGLASQKIISVGKHFPGHGDTLIDSHVDLPVVEKNLKELKKMELKPFEKAIKNKMPALMVGHILVPKVTNDDMPASLSKNMIKNTLRRDLKYTGVIMPDSLKMRALTNYFTNRQICLKGIEAGNDILLMPQDIGMAYMTIFKAIDKGIIDIKRVDDSVYRILSMKFDYGFFDKEYADFVSQRKKKRKLKTLYIR